MRGGGGAGGCFARELIGRCIVPNVCSYVSRNASVNVALKWLLATCRDMPITFLSFQTFEV